MSSAVLLWSFLLLAAGPTGGAGDYFVIEVVDAETGRGVPLVELETVHAVRYYTDSNGIVAFHEPGLMDQSVFFNVRSHGYEFPKDGFGIRGKALKVSPGGSARIEIRRINIAERLYRLQDEILWSPEDRRAPYSLLFDTRSWVDIKPIRTKRFRGFTYNTPPPEEVEPLRPRWAKS